MPVDVVRTMCDQLGLQLLSVPPEYSGVGAGALDVYRVCEAMARIDLGIATGVLATSLGSDPIRIGGTPEQRERWLGRVAAEGLLVACAATKKRPGRAAHRGHGRRNADRRDVCGTAWRVCVMELGA